MAHSVTSGDRTPWLKEDGVGTNPLIARGAVDDISTAARRVGLLYGVDVAGAAAGCFLGTWYFIGSYGLHVTSLVAACMSLCAVAFALLASGTLQRQAAAPVAPRIVAGQARSQLLKWSALYFASGFLAIGLEVVWLRIISVHFQGTAYTFGHVLFIYLAANGAGLLAAAPCVKRIGNHEAAFYFTQFAATAWAVLGLLFVLAWLRRDLLTVPLPSGLLAGFAAFEVFPAFGALLADPRHYLFHMAALPLFLIGPSAFLIGFSFPLV